MNRKNQTFKSLILLTKFRKMFDEISIVDILNKHNSNASLICKSHRMYDLKMIWNLRFRLEFWNLNRCDCCVICDWSSFENNTTISLLSEISITRLSRLINKLRERLACCNCCFHKFVKIDYLQSVAKFISIENDV